MSKGEKFNILFVQFCIPKEEYEKVGFYKIDTNNDRLCQTEFEDMYDEHYNLQKYRTDRLYNGRDCVGNIKNIKYEMTYYWTRYNMYHFDILTPHDIHLIQGVVKPIQLCIKLKMTSGYIDDRDKHYIAVSDNNYNMVSFNKEKYGSRNWQRLMDIFNNRFDKMPLFINSHEFIENNNIEMIGNNIISNDNNGKITIKLKWNPINSVNDDFVILKGCPICKIYNGSLSKFHVMRCIDINNIHD